MSVQTAPAAIGITTIPAMAGAAQACVPCQKRGHRCYAHHIVDGEAQCTFCLDGEPCIWEQREAQARAPKKETPPKRPGAGVPAAAVRRQAADSTAADSTNEKSMQTHTVKTNGHAKAVAAQAQAVARLMEKPGRVCKCGCGGVVPPLQRFGYLKGHMHSRHSGGNLLRQAQPGERACGAGCGRKLRVDNKTGVCTRCQMAARLEQGVGTKHAPAAAIAAGKVRPGAAARLDGRRGGSERTSEPKPIGNAHHDGVTTSMYGRKRNLTPRPDIVPEQQPATFALQVSEAQLDRYVLGLRDIRWERAVKAMPIELKLRLANFVLEHEPELDEEAGTGSRQVFHDSDLRQEREAEKARRA